MYIYIYYVYICINSTWCVPSQQISHIYIFPSENETTKFHGRGLLEGTKLWRFYTQKATFHGDVLLERPFGIGPKAEFCSIGQSVISSIDTWRFRDFRKGDGLPVPVEYLQRHRG